MLAMANLSHVGTDNGQQPGHVKASMFSPPRSLATRPVSEATEIYDTEDDDSVFEESSPKPSFDSFESRRRSDTTISSYDEAATPRSVSSFERNDPFQMRIKSVEGPKGPHLFRASQSSAEFAFDYALQMSPLLPKKMELPSTPQVASPLGRAFSPADLFAPNMNIAFELQTSGNVYQWTTRDVLNWMVDSALPNEVIDKFEKHDINGTILMELEFENLKELDIESFGKRHQLWNAIQNLRGGERGPSPVPTPFQDISRPPTNVRSRSDGDISRVTLPSLSYGDDSLPESPLRHKKRRGRKNRHTDDNITPAESVSIVAIEQLLPKPHKCAKGQNCPKWRKQQKLFARIQEEQGWPISPDHGGHIMISGDPGNAATAQKVLQNVHRPQENPSPQDTYRPVSENIPPSVVASSDLLGPGQLPAFALHENMLSRLQMRDPQENVKQFLNFQHVDVSSMETPPTPPLDTFPSDPFQMFPPVHQQAYPSLSIPDQTQSPHENLKSLPKLSIPRSASANPYLGRSNQVLSPAETVMSPCRSATLSPGATGPIYRYGTPASEMDVPVTAIPMGPISRDTSQSVPPNMQFREHARIDKRRPSAQLPALEEDAVFSPGSAFPRSPYPLHVVDKAKQKEMKKAHIQATYGDNVAYSGYMKKRKNKLLRHEWHNAHFRLHGTQLNMHETNRLSAAMLESFDVDDYSVACANVPSNNKITAALKTLKLSDKKKDADTAAAFAFQLVPSEKDRVKALQSKTHHFAVTTSDERIDWMRELMLAKALRQKHSGFDVEHNGAKA